MITNTKKVIIIHVFYTRWIRELILIGLFLIFCNFAIAQVSIMGGANYCDVRNNNLIVNQKSIFAYQFGVSVRYYPFKNFPNLSIQNELLFNRKGYQQFIDKDYLYQFNYISLPILLSYRPLKSLFVNAGVEISGLVGTNIEQGMKTYNNTDVGLVLGFSCFEKHSISLYSRITYGIVPMLDYYSFDKLGNFTRFHDLRNMCFSAGIKINIGHEEIHLFK